MIPPFKAMTAATPLPVGTHTDTLDYQIQSGIFYYEGAAVEKTDAYQKEKCQLDLYHPTKAPGFATVIWFHGGGMIEGVRAFPGLQNKGLALAGTGYRLSPTASFPAYLEDTAAATAWVLRHIADYGGDPKKVFIAGESAGAYLAAMIGMDPRWLNAHGLSHRQLAGIIPVSAQVTTHYHIKKLLGDTGPELRPLIDEYAPLYYASKDLPPICLITGDRRIEYKNRVEENELFATCLRNLEHPRTEFHEMNGYDHCSIGTGCLPPMHSFIQKILTDPKWKTGAKTFSGLQ
jgi:acetyl esterase/lipase